MIMMRRGRFFLKGIIILIQLWYQFVLVFQFSSCPVARLFLFLWNVSLVAQFMIVLPIFGLSKNPQKLAEHIWELKVPAGLNDRYSRPLITLLCALLATSPRTVSCLCLTDWVNNSYIYYIFPENIIYVWIIYPIGQAYLPGVILVNG